MLAINFNTPSSIEEQIKDNFKQKRLSFDLTQEGLAKKSGVSLGSLKRFESSGKISLESLLKIAFVLQCLDDFLNIAKVEEKINSLDEIINKKDKNTKKRGKIK